LRKDREFVSDTKLPTHPEPFLRRIGIFQRFAA